MTSKEMIFNKQSADSIYKQAVDITTASLQPKRNIFNAFDLLHENINVLESTLEEFCAKLQPVLRPSFPKKEIADKEVNRETYSNINESIRSFAETIEILTKKVEEVKARIDL